MLFSTTISPIFITPTKLQLMSNQGQNMSLARMCTNHFISLHNGNITLADIPVECLKNYSFTSTVIISIILALFTLAIAVGNFLIILSVALVRKLQTPCNLLIVNLACSDFLLSILVLPLAIVYQVVGYWIFDETVCDMFMLFDVLLCTSSILNLCAISIDRYLVITRPLKYAVHRTPRRMFVMIGIAWMTSALISIPPVIGWKKSYQPRVCAYSDDLGYQIYATFIAFYVPLTVMLILYGRIIQIARQMAQADARQMGGGSSRGSMPATPMHVHQPPPATAEDLQGCSPSHSESHRLLRLDSSVPPSPLNGHTIRSAILRHLNAKIAIPLSSPRPKQKYNESKAVKTLGVIMGCFTICWLPFFAFQLLKAVLEQFTDIMNNLTLLFQIFLWLGYINSLFNPVIYAKFNREFRIPMLEIMRCRCHLINRRLRNDTFAEQYGLTTTAAATRRQSAMEYLSPSTHAKNGPRPSQLYLSGSSTNL